MVERNDAQHVDKEKLLDLGSLDIFDQRVGFHYAGVGDDNIKVIDMVLLLDLLDDVEGILLGRGFILHHNQAATLALRQVGKRLRG